MSMSPDPSELSLLVELLFGAPPVARRSAAEQLAGHDDPVALQALVVALGSDEGGVRECAARALGHSPAPEAFNALKRAATGRRRDRSARVRAAVALALSRHDSDDCRTTLLRMLRDRSREPRRMAAFALGRLRVGEAIPALARHTRGKDPVLRAVAVWSLGAVTSQEDGEPARAALIRALSDSSGSVRRLAAEALGRQPSPGPSAVEGLVSLLEDPEAVVRLAAAWSLAQIGSLVALPALRSRRALWRETNAEVRAVCRRAVAELEAIARGQPREVIPAVGDEGSGTEVAPG